MITFAKFFTVFMVTIIERKKIGNSFIAGRSMPGNALIMCRCVPAVSILCYDMFKSSSMWRYKARTSKKVL